MTVCGCIYRCSKVTGKSPAKVGLGLREKAPDGKWIPTKLPELAMLEMMEGGMISMRKCPRSKERARRNPLETSRCPLYLENGPRIAVSDILAGTLMANPEDLEGTLPGSAQRRADFLQGSRIISRKRVLILPGNYPMGW